MIASRCDHVIIRDDVRIADIIIALSKAGICLKMEWDEKRGTQIKAMIFEKSDPNA